MSGKISYSFSTKVWKHEAPGGWHFVSLPKDISKEIRKLLKWQEEGWGRLKVIAFVGNTEWNTAIWYDSKASTYLLPLKAIVRKQERIELEKTIEVTIHL